MTYMRFQLLVAALVALVMLTSACAPKDDGPSATTATPTQTETSGSGTFCGDLLVWSQGMVFKVDQTTYGVNLVPDGEYGYGAYHGGWGTPIPACHYAVVADHAPYLLIEPIQPNN